MIRSERIISKVERVGPEAEGMNLTDTFRPAYEAFCDYYDTEPLPAVVWVFQVPYLLLHLT